MKHKDEFIQRADTVRNIDYIKTHETLGEGINPDKKSTIFYPGQYFYNIWAIIISIMLIYECTINPYRLAFNIENTPFYFYLNESITVIFFLDIIINFRTAYYNEYGELIDDSREVARNYLTSWFFIDLISTIPFEYFSTDHGDGHEKDSGLSQANSILRFYRIQKIFKLFKIMRLVRFGKFYKNKDKIITNFS